MKHANFVDKFLAGPRLVDLPKETVARLAEIADATCYLRMVLTLGEVYLIHDKKDMITSAFLHGLVDGEVVGPGEQRAEFRCSFAACD